MGQGCMKCEVQTYEDQVDRQNKGKQTQRLLSSRELRIKHPGRSVELTLRNEMDSMGYAEENALRVGRGVVLRVFDVAVALSEGC